MTTSTNEIASFLAGKDLALPQGSLILVTGASGYIGAHVVNEALLAGYKVRGTSRTLEKCNRSKQLFSNNPNHSTAVVANYDIDNVFDEAIQDCDAVIHVASDMTFGPHPNEVITPVVKGTKSILRSAAKNASVKRFVLTSSSCAVLMPSLDRCLRVGKKDWNEDSIKKAWESPPYTVERAVDVYAASKTEGERALWEFVKDEKPAFVANAILPNVNMGGILSSPGVTGDAVLRVSRGEIPKNIGPQYMIDVIDDARLHIIAAVLDGSLENDRIFAFNVAFNWTDIVNAIKEVRPAAVGVAIPQKDEPRDLSEVPNEQGAKLLREWYAQETGYKPLVQTVRENLEEWV
ncbi:NAD(P)-binding protein [Tothia fuscella]|uniref:NAD(P)-binding protein n=1 Tax=Tothia fuscella TaxID=1048955 RepID=A0A9P4NS90_9PEZI|nr:NAD(P)-binding protein [Tothia fuscella]